MPVPDPAPTRVPVPDPAPAGPRLSSVTAALRLLKALAREPGAHGITALARELKLAKSTVHRLASTLVAEGYVEQDAADGRYRLGLALFALGTTVRRRMNVSVEAKPVLDALRDATGETVHLAVLTEVDVLYLYKLAGTHAVGPRTWLGMRRPAHCTAEGRALLAHAPVAVRQRVAGAGLHALTARTETDLARWARLLDVARQTGHAVDEGECEDDTRTVAAPVFDAQGSAVAAVGVTAPASRLTRKALRALVPAVEQAAREISRRMGWPPDGP
jgi:IclR family KDG regulon transcriptional repressor